MSTPIQASFNVNKGIDGISMIPIDGSSVIAGNSDAADIKLENQYVSRRHLQVRQDVDIFYLSDLDSTNGTYLNNNKLAPDEEHVIRDGDRVVLGSTGFARSNQLLTESARKLKMFNGLIASEFGKPYSRPVGFFFTNPEFIMDLWTVTADIPKISTADCASARDLVDQ